MRRDTVSPTQRVPRRWAFALLAAAAVVLAWLAWSRPLRTDHITPRAIGFQLRLNHDDADRLRALHGVGPALAQAIVAHRETHGPFVSLDELELVVGIGPRTRSRIEPWVTLD